MKPTTHFKQTIQNYLEERALNDTLFSVSFRKPNKSMDDCITYILNTVQKSGCNGFTDDEVYSMAVHYYDEDDLDVGKANPCNVVVNHTVELTAEEKEQARKNAMQRAEKEAYNRITQPKKKAVAKQPEAEGLFQLNLF
jgi:hypothetical protein